jgi:hypothetical protein
METKTIRQRQRSILALILAMVLLIGMFPAGAFATAYVGSVDDGIQVAQGQTISPDDDIIWQHEVNSENPGNKVSLVYEFATFEDGQPITWSYNPASISTTGAAVTTAAIDVLSISEVFGHADEIYGSSDNLNVTNPFSSYLSNNSGIVTPDAYTDTWTVKRIDNGYETGYSVVKTITLQAYLKLTVNGITAQNKTYDGTVKADLVTDSATIRSADPNSSLALPAEMASEYLGNSISGTYADKNVGTGKAVTISASFAGTSLADVAVMVTPEALTADIEPRTVVPTYITISKVYDGTNTITSFSDAEFEGEQIVTGDAITVESVTGIYLSTDVSEEISLSISAFTLGGADSANYSAGANLSDLGNLTGEITARPVTVSAIDQNILITEDIATGPSMATLTGALDGHTLYSVDLNSIDNAVIRPSNAVIHDGSDNDVTENYAISYVEGELSVRSSFTISFDSNGGTTVEAITQEYGSDIIAPSDPTKTGYTFGGWNPAIPATMPAIDSTSVAIWNINSYTIYWMDGNGELLVTSSAVYNTTPVYEGPTPTKDETDQYTYTFNDTWSPTIVPATDDAEYVAQFDQTTRSYVITWIDGNGEVLSTSSALYGDTPSYTGAAPTKDSTDQYVYSFNNSWSPTIAAVTGDAEYTAQFDQGDRSYTITWIDGDGEVLSTSSAVYGSTPSYTGATPTKTATAQYTYTFNNTWSPAIAAVTGDAEYTAQFDSSENSYVITWIDGDEEVLSTSSAVYGSTPSYSGATPTKTATAQYTYTFNNSWSPAIASVTADAEYTAQFDSSENSYVITWIDGNGEVLSTSSAVYGTTPSYSGATPTKTATAQYTYTFNNTWSPAIESVSGNAEYTAQFDSTGNKYTVTFLKEDGTTISSLEYDYGTAASAVTVPEIPEKDADDNGHYTGSWDAAVADVTADAAYKAEYTASAHSFDNGVITMEPTELAEGEKTFTCSVCGYTKTEPVAPLNHTHDWETAWESDENYHWHACTGCSEKSELTAHTWDDGEVTEEATETEPGMKVYTCTVCEYEKFEEIPALGHQHQWEEIWQSDETGHWHACTGCSEKGSFADHTWAESIVEQPTYEREGLKNIYCSVCDYTQPDPVTIPRLTPSSDDDDDDDDGPTISGAPSLVVTDADGNRVDLSAIPNGIDTGIGKPEVVSFSYFGRTNSHAPTLPTVYFPLQTMQKLIVYHYTGGNLHVDSQKPILNIVHELPKTDAPVQNDYNVGDVQEADYTAPNYKAEGDASSIIQASSIEGSEFYTVNTATADKTVKYADLKPGDVVRTTAFNGIYVTSLDKKSATYDADAKTLKNNIFASFVAFDMDHPEVFWLTGNTKVRVTSVTKGDKSTAYFFLVLVDDKGFNMLQQSYLADGALEAALKQRDENADKILAGVDKSADRKTLVQELNKWLTLNNEYNRTPDLSTIGYTPHRSVSALAGSTGNNGPVCDGYARAFKLLCDRIGVPCVLQGGYAFVAAGANPEYHMWNQVQMEDGNWYGVDICWNDPVVSGAPAPVSGKENESWLFAGSDTVIGGLKFADSHQPEAQSDGDANYFSSLNIYLSGYTNTAGSIFEDVSLANWYYDSVKKLQEEGLMEGTSEGKFSPDALTNKAQVSMILYRMAGQPEVTHQMVLDANIADNMPRGVWYFDAFTWAVANGLMEPTGYSSKLASYYYDPLGPARRDTIITMLYRYADSIGKAGMAPLSGLDRFTDKDQIADPALTPMAWAVENGIMEGKSSSHLAPEDTATRAELSVIITRFLEKFK